MSVTFLHNFNTDRLHFCPGLMSLVASMPPPRLESLPLLCPACSLRQNLRWHGRRLTMTTGETKVMRWAGWIQEAGDGVERLAESEKGEVLRMVEGRG